MVPQSAVSCKTLCNVCELSRTTCWVALKRQKPTQLLPQNLAFQLLQAFCTSLKRYGSRTYPHLTTLCCGQRLMYFFGFLRAGEFTVPSLTAYDPKVHLNLADLALDSHTSPSLIRLTIKQSKTDPLRQGVEIYLGTTHATVCPILLYLHVRSPHPGPLFVFQSGAPLTRSSLVTHLKTALTKAGIDHTNFNGHSLRIGAATTAVHCGLEDSLIQTLGRWKSAAYKTYIRLPRSQLAAVSRSLAQ